MNKLCENYHITYLNVCFVLFFSSNKYFTNSYRSIVMGPEGLHMYGQCPCICDCMLYLLVNAFVYNSQWTCKQIYIYKQRIYKIVILH